MPSHAESSLEAGLVALKQGNYQTAIAHLEPLVSSQGNGTASLQAKVGLVMAYARSGKADKAIALCESLIHSQNPQVKEWAERALTHLTKRKKNKESKNLETGFVAFDNSRSNNPQAAASQKTKVAAVTPRNATAVPPGSYQKTFIEKPAVPPGGFLGAGYTQIKEFGIYWRQAKRAKVWQPLRKPNLIPLRLLAAGTFIALFCVLREIIKFVMGFINYTLVKLPYLEPLQLLYRDPTYFLMIVLFVLVVVSPWLLDWLLASYGQRELSKDVLNNHSRETGRVLHRYCQQRHWPMPRLRILPIAAPMTLTYGNLPRTARIVVSQGLLEQLADDEIATIYAGQLGHIAHWDFVVMSLVLLVTLPMYMLYRQVSHWGDKTNKIWRVPFTILSSIFYGVWCFLTGTALWLSRLRLYYSDRLAAEITGNPNALTRALLKIAIGVAGDVQKAEHTSWQLESLNILTPVGYQQSLALGSVAGHLTFESILTWDNLNPYRRWLAINNTHPLIGDRIQRLCQIAQHWHIDTELHLTNQQSLSKQSLEVTRQSFLLQTAPFLGVPLGFLFAGLIWLLWQTAFSLKFLNLKWIYEDWSFVIGCLLIGFSIGMVIRMNSFFPDIKSTNAPTNDLLPSLLANPSTIPIDSIQVHLVGKLLGRRGTSNSLAQDFILQSGTGLVKLHHISWLGQPNLQDFIGRQITVTGWFRRGATPWIDIQTLQTQGGKTIHSPHPIWSTVLAVAAQAWGAYIFLMG
ncbi:M48 family metalloprotease [Nostocaceae cyanobacterium CENA369]|uniref:M48 family metalloprotease n=1 Tax=Dendronalium phyllosphericum CENA369 TaxID=1725256 RepID=A0A8J7LJG3_9NOST|nr:M48 family metallopeptidase [Dendronalium phyllosphericum]MBH8577504.1 M48 family metalloprotease [Dendronalium phyllosphericum CENA369]